MTPDDARARPERAATPRERGAERAAVDAVLSASRALVAVAARSLADAGEEVTLPQYRALVVLASHGQRSVSELAEALDVTPSTATRMCDRLVRKRLVSRRAGREDRRRIEVALTAHGRELVDDVTRRRRRELERILSSVPAVEQRSIAESLRRLAAAAGEPHDSDWTEGWGL